MSPTHTETLVHQGLYVDDSDFRRFAKALRKADRALYTELRIRLRAAGNIVANEARVYAADASVTIPPTIKVRTSMTSVAVIAGGAGTPLAGLMELGNSSKRHFRTGSRSGTFRHPVFGNKSVWVTQPMHPYLAPALRANFAEAEYQIEAALDWAIRVAVTDDGGSAL